MCPWKPDSIPQSTTAGEHSMCVHLPWFLNSLNDLCLYWSTFSTPFYCGHFSMSSFFYLALYILFVIGIGYKKYFHCKELRLTSWSDYCIHPLSNKLCKSAFLFLALGQVWMLCKFKADTVNIFKNKKKYMCASFTFQQCYDLVCKLKPGFAAIKSLCSLFFPYFPLWQLENFRHLVTLVKYKLGQNIVFFLNFER